jgi:hypothetical protein
VKGYHVLFCKRLDNPHHKYWFLWLGCLGANTSWQDRMTTAPVWWGHWQRKQSGKREAHNDIEAAHWEVEAPDSWGGTHPPSPIPISEGWPCVRVVTDGTYHLM